MAKSKRALDPLWLGRKAQGTVLSYRNDLRILLVAGIVALAPLPSRAQTFCVDVKTVALDGITLLDIATQSALVTPFEGRCLGLPEINEVLQAVTLAYVDRGYVTARAYLPEQDLSTGRLEVKVIEGTLARVEINDQVQTRWQARVFPGQIGKPVQLRDVEQGLDVIRSMPGYRAEMEITAGEAEGASVLEVTAEADRPWQLQIATNNHGLDSSEPGQAAATGQFITSLNASWSHALGLNETWILGLGKSIANTPFDLTYDGPGTRNADLGLRLPFGRWRFDAAASWSDYATSTPGVLNPIAVTGQTTTFSLGAERLLHRDRDSKTWAGVRLERRDAENEIAGVRIEASSRVVTALRLQGRHTRVALGGQLTVQAGIEQGLNLFGAEDDAAQPVGTPEAQYTLVDAAVSYVRPFETNAGQVIWDSSLAVQYSGDRLYGTEQFSLGGISTIRGTKIQLLAGSSGTLWRNELQWVAPVKLPRIFGALQVYGGLDLGWVAGQSSLGVVGGHASGAVLGLRTLGGPLSLDVSYAEVVSTPSGSAPDDGTLLVSAIWRF